MALLYQEDRKFQRILMNCKIIPVKTEWDSIGKKYNQDNYFDHVI